ncbi:transposase, partial [Aliikangiella maris]
MPRPLRIEYEDAYYHVMSRGRDKGRRNIFHSEKFYTAFLETLAEACERFEIVVHAYCLMTNHYHLLVQTPLGNLGRWSENKFIKCWVTNKNIKAIEILLLR